MNKGVATATERAVAFLQSTQLPSGNFESFSSPTRQPFSDTKAYQTTLVPALILSALADIQTAAVQKITDRLASWLLAERSAHWSFNYWAAAAHERTQLPYPDDLDDTFCALLALHSYKPALIDEPCLAHIVKLLIATEQTVGGPYRTWLVTADTPKIWHDVDLAVNSNIAAFLARVAEPLPNLTAFMQEAITARRFSSPYYPSPMPLIYYMARAHLGDRSEELADYICSLRTQKAWGTPLQTALAISALCRLGRSKECVPAARWLLSRQAADGSWPAEAFCLDPAIQNQTHYNGASALTTALALEALHLQTRPKPAAPPPRKITHIDAIYTGVMSIAQNEIRACGPSLRPAGRTLLQHIGSGENGREIVLLPALFYDSLQQQPILPSNMLQELGLANLYGWLAYTVYDDFLDDEGQPRRLPMANVALRYSIEHFRRALPHDEAYQRHVAHTFNAIDNANAWEVNNCRFAVTPSTITLRALPAYGNSLTLANRSLGHTLTPLGVLAAAGTAPASLAAKELVRALRHYLVARQLNDDLHDWSEDLRRGHITFVVASLLDDLSLRPRTYRFATLLPTIERHFWRHSLAPLSGIVIQHTKLARYHARKSGLLTDQSIIDHLADGVEQIARYTLAEQTKAERFLESYAQTDPNMV